MATALGPSNLSIITSTIPSIISVLLCPIFNTANLRRCKLRTVRRMGSLFGVQGGVGGGGPVTTMEVVWVRGRGQNIVPVATVINDDGNVLNLYYLKRLREVDERRAHFRDLAGERAPIALPARVKGSDKRGHSKFRVVTKSQRVQGCLCLHQYQTQERHPFLDSAGPFAKPAAAPVLQPSSSPACFCCPPTPAQGPLLS